MVSTEELLLRLVLGAVFGGLIGYERQVHGRPAGFRTHILVCTSTVLLMEISAYSYLTGPQGADLIRIDPGRIAAGAITGIGFLGAGVIIKLGATVQGLTTAASIWMAAAIGLAVGAGHYVTSAAACALDVVALLTLRGVEILMPRSVVKTVRLSTDCSLREEAVAELLGEHDGTVLSTDYEVDETGGDCSLLLRVAFGRRHKAASLGRTVEALSALDGVRRVSLSSQ